MKTQDHELATLISITLRTGILIAVTCAVLGCILYLPALSTSSESFKTFQGSQVPFTSLSAIGVMVSQSASMAERGLGIAEIGVLILMVTPIVRVVISLISFLHTGDRLFSGITIVVLAALACSILIH